MQVIHLDVADFAVAVERVVDPGLCNRPVILAPDADRALVATVSREARREGVRPGMPLREALRRCGGARVVRPNEPLYARAFKAVGEVAGRFSPVLEPVSPGRIYLDVTGTDRLFGPPLDLAARLRRELSARLRLDAAVGVAANKLVSRVAADLTEPDGLLDVRTGDEAPFLAPLRVQRLPGVGAAVGRELDALNIRWVRQLAVMEPAHLDLAFGRFGAVLRQRALGIDPRPVQPPLRKPEVQREETLVEDSNDPAVLRAAFRTLVESAGLELRVRGLTAARMALELRYADSRATARSVRARRPLQQISELWRSAEELLEAALSRRVRVRHLRFRLAGLASRPRQMELFGEPSPERPLTTAMDRIRTRFGETALLHGLQLP
ncbi:MAG: DNA polymerase IV [Acidobacteria bacterium]|uniref:DNA polymerase IV n=1 Tax=Candidatus Polarisedimenticola svalbardensis TaxID=2886004 RepID=A0A8J6Y1A1_9BACT|nr:DNA polymerase IV [Candidatus Polarisedimenticola svalbardensis]